MSFVANFIRFPAVQKFSKSVKIWQSYRQFKGGNFLRQCRSEQILQRLRTTLTSLTIRWPTIWRRQHWPYVTVTANDAIVLLPIDDLLSQCTCSPRHRVCCVVERTVSSLPVGIATPTVGCALRLPSDGRLGWVGLGGCITVK